MNTPAESSEVTLLRRCFEALSEGDFATLERALAKDAIWRTVDEGPTNCVGRETIVEVMGRNLGGRVRGSIEELSQHDSRVLVAFRPPERPTETPQRPLDRGIAYMVVTIEEGQIAELKGCADRAAALAYAQTGAPPEPPATVGVRAPESVPEPPGQRANRLVPFVQVAEVERSVAFYHHLGFSPESVYEYRGQLVWAALRSEDAEIMFERSGEPIDPAGQSVLFYLYSEDLAALRDQLLAAGIPAGAIEDGSPGPREEMRLTDPDGYVLMVAQVG